MSDTRTTIGAAARASGCNVETIRFYEREGLLPAPRRTEGGHRLYDATAVRRLRFIRRSRQLGFSMPEVRELLSLVDGDQVSCERVQAMADAHIAEIRTKIADLRGMLATLETLSRQCSGADVPDCPIVETLQRAAADA